LMLIKLLVLRISLTATFRSSVDFFNLVTKMFPFTKIKY